MKKTARFHLIILDESGSMSGCRQATIKGCNETIAAVRNLQKEFGEDNSNFVSIYAFQSGKIASRYLCRNLPVDKVRDVTPGDYCPHGCTPLLDAVGSTLVDLEAVASTHDDASATVTIITDGCENDSRRYTPEMVARIIDRLKEKGWTFNLIGANIDVLSTGAGLHIDNTMEFANTEKGTADMFDTFCKDMETYHRSCIMEERIIDDDSIESRIALRKSKSKSFFSTDSDINK